VFFNTGSMYHLAVMMRPTTLAQRIIRQWCWTHWRRRSVASGGDDASIDVGPTYHLVVMMPPSMPA
jgi:hypothetical protein